MNTEIMGEMSDSESDECSESEKLARRGRILHTDDNHNSMVKFSVFFRIKKSQWKLTFVVFLIQGTDMCLYLVYSTIV